MNDVCPGGVKLNLAPLKGRARRRQSAERVRGQDGAVLLVALRHRARLCVCDHEDELVALWTRRSRRTRASISSGRRIGLIRRCSTATRTS